MCIKSLQKPITSFRSLFHVFSKLVISRKLMIYWLQCYKISLFFSRKSGFKMEYYSILLEVLERGMNF